LTFLLSALSCKSNPESEVSTVNHIEARDIVRDSVIVIDEYKLQPLFRECDEISNGLNEDYEFLNSNMDIFHLMQCKIASWKVETFIERYFSLHNRPFTF